MGRARNDFACFPCSRSPRRIWTFRSFSSVPGSIVVIRIKRYSLIKHLSRDPPHLGPGPSLRDDDARDTCGMRSTSTYMSMSVTRVFRFRCPDVRMFGVQFPFPRPRLGSHSGVLTRDSPLRPWRHDCIGVFCSVISRRVLGTPVALDGLDFEHPDDDEL